VNEITKTELGTIVISTEMLQEHGIEPTVLYGCMSAYVTDHKWGNKDNVAEDIIIPMGTIAKKLKWSRWKVMRYEKYLIEKKFITQKTRIRRGTKYNIKRYAAVHKSRVTGRATPSKAEQSGSTNRE
jgi:hypothetical protein